MKNPWEEISLTDYENHMRLDSVMQLQAMNEMMKGQFETYSVSSVMILGIAGGNGLEHIAKNKFEKVYGVDVNSDYLKETTRRYPDLDGILECLCIDLIKESDKLPKADMVIANLLIEYIGYACFQKAIQQADPKYVSCIIQINTEEDWVSDSPYLHVFDGLEEVHHQIEEHILEKAMLEIDYHVIEFLEHRLPNGKKLVQMDFERRKSTKNERGAVRLSTRQTTYAFALLMLFLVVCTIMLSVKHEQKRLSEKMTLQEGPLVETTVQAEEETVTIEADATIGQEESESIEGGTVIEDDKHFTIIDAGEQTYPYTIYNADGEAVKSEVCYRIAPWIHYIDQETLEIHIGVGTETFYCVYYDILNDRFSEQYESPVAAEYHKVAFLDHRDDEIVLVVRDMFDEKNYYKEFHRDFAAAVSPVTYAEFKFEDTLLFTYMASDFFETQKYKTELLFCGGSEEKETSASDAVDYVDEELYAEIKDICKNIDFTPSFDPGDVTKYDLYKKKFKKFINGEVTVWIKETGEELYIYNFHGLEEFRAVIELGEYDIDRYSYYFFDINGDEDPELCIKNQLGYIYVFQYDEDRDQIVLWKEYISNSIFLMGTQKLGFAGGWSGDGMIRVDENGDRVFFVHFWVLGGGPYQNDIEDYGFLVSLPEYIELRDDMIEQAIYEDDRYYFRVTEEQFEELTKDYNDAEKAVHAALDEVTYTYTELFD